MGRKAGVIFSMVSFRPLEIPADMQRSIDLFVKAGGVYVPELIGDNERYRHGDSAQLERNWIQEDSFGGLLFKREKPIVVNTVLTFTDENFRRRAPHHFFVSIDGVYFDSTNRLLELVDLGNSIYDLLLPCYGFIELPWLPSLKATTIPDRGFPGWGWATWVGPEYDTIIRFPPLAEIRIISMSDGGRLILLPSPESVGTPDQRCVKAYRKILGHIDDRAFQTPIESEVVDSQHSQLSSHGTGRHAAGKEVLLPRFRFRN